MKNYRTILSVIILVFFIGQGFTQDKQSEDINKDWAWMYLRGDIKGGKAKKNFKLMKESGIDGLLILEPRMTDEEFENIAGIAKDQGLEVHIWIPTTNPHGGRGMAKEHPDWYQVSREGISCLDKPPYIPSYKWLCPNNPEAHDYLVNMMKDLAQKDFLDGVHLDYIRFPDVILPVGLQPKYDLVQDSEFPEFDFCYCEHCRKKFKDKFKIDPLNIDDPAGNKDWVQFRYNSITELVNDIYKVVNAEGKLLSAAVFPTPELAKKLVRQDWTNWKIDALMPMIYHEYYNEPLCWIEIATSEGVQGLNGKTPYYSGVFTGWIEAEEMAEMVKHAKAGGANGICLFNANNMSKKQWKELGKALNNK